MNKRYRILTTLLESESMEKLSLLFAYENVKFRKEDNSIISTSTPIAVLGVDKRLYTRKNWFGINPFIFITRIQVACRKNAEGKTEVDVLINQNRAVFIYGLAMALVLIVSCALPDVVWGGLFFVSAAAVLFLCFSFLAGPLIRIEIQSELSEQLL